MKKWHFYIKIMLLTVFATTTSFQLFANDDWEAAYKKELKESGYTPKEIADIIKAEKEKRAKANKAKADNTEKNNTATKSSSEKAPVKKLTREEEKAKLENIEAQWKELLTEEYKLKDKDLKEVLKIEMSVQKKLIKLTEEQQFENDDALHIEASLKRVDSLRIISNSKLGKNRAKRYLTLLSQSWEDWLYLSKDKLKSHITSIVEDYKALEIESREKRAKETRDATIKEIDATTRGFFQRRGMRRGGAGRGGNGWPRREAFESKTAKLCGVYWDKLIVHLTEDEYDDAKKEASKYLKKNGVSKDTLKIFYKALDPFIDDDHEEKIDLKRVGKLKDEEEDEDEEQDEDEKEEEEDDDR